VQDLIGVGTEAVEAQQHDQGGKALVGASRLARICGHDEAQNRVW
jgi:hypothetical protein